MSARNAARKLDAKARSLFVKVIPAPTTLSERRAVLHSLQRHGKIEVFKQLTDKAQFAAITSTSTSANELIQRSPFEIKYVHDAFRALSTSTPVSTYSPTTGQGGTAIASPVKVIDSISNASANASTGKTVDTNTARGVISSFVIHIFPSINYRHKTTIREQQIHGPWPIEGGSNNKDFVYHALQQVVPAGLAREGLCDWSTGQQLSEEASIMREELKGTGLVFARGHRSPRSGNVSGDNRPITKTLADYNSLEEIRAAVREEAAGVAQQADIG